VASTGELGPELLQRTAELVGQLIDQARSDGAERVGLVGTEALRNAADGAALRDRIRQQCKQQLRILTGEAEARLSYLGGTAFRVPAGQPATVIDVGGGSTEVVHGLGSRPVNGISLKLGSDRILLAIKASDPPTARQRVDAEMRISMLLEAAPEAAQQGELIASGGTASNLPVLLGVWRPFPDSKDTLRDEDSRESWITLNRENIEQAVHLTAAHSSAEVAMRTGVSPARARLMAGGVLVLLGLLERYRAQELVVTERGLRDGVLLRLASAAAEHGPD
jgi:exopolyphosphatase/guanosine-5'-triphosphate,3'-diphosphate pyrophosphatase